jgi:hypothetical protein
MREKIMLPSLLDRMGCHDEMGKRARCRILSRERMPFITHALSSLSLARKIWCVSQYIHLVLSLSLSHTHTDTHTHPSPMASLRVFSIEQMSHWWLFHLRCAIVAILSLSPSRWSMVAHCGTSSSIHSSIHYPATTSQCTLMDGSLCVEVAISPPTHS